MGLFRKKEEKKSCCCKSDGKTQTMENAQKTKTGNEIKILGSGCAKCTALESAVRTAILEMNLDLEIKHITDFVEIASYGVMSTPAIVLNEKVISYGKVLSVEEVKEILTENR